MVGPAVAPTVGRLGVEALVVARRLLILAKEDPDVRGRRPLTQLTGHTFGGLTAVGLAEHNQTVGVWCRSR